MVKKRKNLGVEKKQLGVIQALLLGRANENTAGT